MLNPSSKPTPLFHGPIVRRAIVDSFRKLDPRVQVRNPVMFIVAVGSVLTTVLGVAALFGVGETAWIALQGGASAEAAAAAARQSAGFILTIAVWLWFTVLFANFAEAVAEGRGKAQADSLRRTLAARDGAIVPMIEDRPDGSYDLTRLVVEKVASINTTAAGGNASLMSLAGE